jgi:hypothetical protein
MVWRQARPPFSVMIGVSPPTRPSGRGLLEEVTDDGFRPPLYDPPGGLYCQARRLAEVFLSPDMPLGPVGPIESQARR